MGDSIQPDNLSKGSESELSSSLEATDSGDWSRSRAARSNSLYASSVRLSVSVWLMILR